MSRCCYGYELIDLNYIDVDIVERLTHQLFGKLSLCPSKNFWHYYFLYKCHDFHTSIMIT